MIHTHVYLLLKELLQLYRGHCVCHRFVTIDLFIYLFHWRLISISEYFTYTTAVRTTVEKKRSVPLHTWLQKSRAIYNAKSKDISIFQLHQLLLSAGLSGQ